MTTLLPAQGTLPVAAPDQRLLTLLFLLYRPPHQIYYYTTLHAATSFAHSITLTITFHPLPPSLFAFILSFLLPLPLACTCPQLSPDLPALPTASSCHLSSFLTFSIALWLPVSEPSFSLVSASVHPVTEIPFFVCLALSRSFTPSLQSISRIAEYSVYPVFIACLRDTLSRVISYLEQSLETFATLLSSSTCSRLLPHFSVPRLFCLILCSCFPAAFDCQVTH